MRNCFREHPVRTEISRSDDNPALRSYVAASPLRLLNASPALKHTYEVRIVSRVY